MKVNRRAFIKKMNWALAGILSMLGFVGCNKTEPLDEYGTPHADYTVKGAVIDKATRKPIKGIRVGYGCEFCPVPEYGVPSTPYVLKTHVTTDAKGEFKLTDSFFPEESQKLPVYVDDIDGNNNGLFQSEILQVDFKDAVHSGKQKSWYNGEYTVNINVELTKIEDK